MAVLRSTHRLADKLAKISRSTQGLPKVSIGFVSSGTYSDGASIPTVAAINEFGNPANNQPPRPFFRNAIAENKEKWGPMVSSTLKATDFNVPKTLDRMGQEIKGEIQDSIRDLTDPPLAPSTIRKKGFDKPLVDTSIMLNSVDYRVEA